MGLFGKKKEKVVKVNNKPKIAKSNEHYMLKCIDCDFTYHIPKDTSVTLTKYHVDTGEVKIVCVFGGKFTVSLEVKEFFTIEIVPESGRILHVSIADNMKPLHAHMLTHCDPLFLIIKQSQNQTIHKYKKQPEGNTYVRFTKDRGVDIVGNIDVAKAEIPGIS